MDNPNKEIYMSNQDVSKSSRIMCLFSCGAASAVATKMAIDENIKQYNKPLIIVNNFVQEEHEDNLRFLRDCESWYNHDIMITKNEEYDGSIYNVFESKKMLKRKFYAPCTENLKRQVRDKLMQENDIIVVGFSVEEKERYERFKEATTNYTVWAPLIERGFTKTDCLETLKKNANIELPYMYKLGYKNNNCIGCIKGGKGYWNKIRVDFPEQFERMAAMEQKLGEGAYLFYDAETKKRVSLRDLKPHEGNYAQEDDEQCSVMCSMNPLFHKDMNGDWQAT
jgi:3'-phosphoadenosine 5'-phosphosulfate sulfotransferase (PAPS reductase)/FAD synthetase